MDPTYREQHVPPPGEGPAAFSREAHRDEAGNLAEEIACRRCGYILRGLPVDGRCPECGTAVGWSIHGDLLRYSDPAWVRHLADGLLWLIVSIFLTIGMGIAGGAFDEMLGNSLASTLAGTLASAVGVVGYWKVTMHDPGKPEAATLVTIPRATRWLAVAGLLAGPAALIGELSGQTMDAAAVISIAGVAVFSLAGMVAALLLFILLRRLARRIPNDGLAKQTGIVMWGTISCYGVFILGGAILALYVASAVAAGGGGMTGGAGMAGFGIALIFGACIGGIVFLGFVVWWIVLLFLYRKALSTAADTALQTWMRFSAEQPAAD